MRIVRSREITGPMIGRRQGPPEHLRWVMWVLTVFIAVKPKPLQL